MSTGNLSKEKAHIQVENIGGITSSTVTFEPGVTVLSGRNATNRTSMLQAIMGVLGSDEVSLKADADEGLIELQLDQERFTRYLTRQNGTVSFEGNPFLSDSTAADCFAFLLEDNPARRAVRRGEDLREVIMEPVDTEAIEAEITRLQNELREIDRKIDRTDELESRAEVLTTKKAELESQLEEQRETLRAKKDEFEAADADLDESKSQKARRESTLNELQAVRSSLENVRHELASERESLEALRNERSGINSELTDIPDAPTEELAELEAQIEQLQERKLSVEETLTQLQNIIQFNSEMIEEGELELHKTVSDAGDGSGQSVTDQIVSDTTVCWTCGSEVGTDAIRETIDDLRELHRTKVSERDTVVDELSELKQRRNELENQKQHRERLQERLDEIDAEIANREAAIDELEARKADRGAEVQALEDEVEELEDEYTELLELHKEINRREVEIESIKDELEQVEDELREVQQDLETFEGLEETRAELRSELDAARTRVKRLEQTAVESFNENMQTILDLLGYQNLERIWIERTETEVREGRKKVTRGRLELHVIRSTDDGTVYEDTIDHLSESEREVTGLVFALAGYLVHDLHETAPFMLLDSLEALDSERIAMLIDYFSDHAPHIVVALLPEDTVALPEEYQRVTEI